MKHLSKERKQKLLLVLIGTLGVLVGIWFALISWQQGRLAALAKERNERRIKLDTMTDTLERAAEIARAVEAGQQQLDEAESQMASGDHYAWVINTIREFKAKHPRISIPQYSTILVEDTKLLPKFPYQQATLKVAGRAYYHDLGVFIADFENEHPYIRIENLEIDPASGEGGYSEKLAFRMDVVALVKPEAKES